MDRRFLPLPSWPMARPSLPPAAIAWLRRSALLLGAIFPLAATAAEDYAIKFERPKKVGDRYQMVARTTRKHSMATTADGRPQMEKHEVMAVELMADVEVLAISPRGKPRKIRLSSTQLAVRSEGRPVEICPDGTEITAELVGTKSQYLIGDRPANEQASKALELVARLSPDDPSDDAILGTEQRQKVGDRWPLNAEGAAASLASTLGLKVSPRDVVGGCVLKEVLATEGGPSLRIDGEIAVSNFNFPLPGGAAVQKGSTRAKLSGLFPVDVRKGTTESSMTMDIDIEVAGVNPAGAKMKLTTKGSVVAEVRYTYPEVP